MPVVPVEAHEKSPLASKKFVAYFVAEATWKGLLMLGLWMIHGHLEDAGIWVWWWMITVTVSVTFLEVGTILGIAYVDRFVRVAAITASVPGSVKDHLVERNNDR